MSVQLTPKNQLDQEDQATVDLPNGTWLALTELSEAYSLGAEKWNGHHDPQFYSPEQLTAIADKVDEIRNLAHTSDWLRWLAKEGGAVLG